MKPLYKQSLIQLMGSIKKHFTQNETDSLEKIDSIIMDYKKIVLVLMDGLGDYNLNDLASPNSLLQSSKEMVIQTVYPSTTVAATTTVCSGLAPITTGWIGWHQYFKEDDRSYIMFLNYGYYDGIMSKEPINQKLTFPYFWDQLAVESHVYAPFPCYINTQYYPDLKSMFDEVLKHTKNDNKQYHYVYYDKLDTLMHNNGVHSLQVQNEFHHIEKDLQYLKENKDEDTLVIVIADHGHIDVSGCSIYEHHDIVECFKHPPALEGRCMTFYLKEDKKELFKERFNAYYREDFILYTHEEVFDLHFFGYGECHPRIHDFIGDYVAIAVGNKMFSVSAHDSMKGNHAGMTKEEMEIPVILFK